MNLTGQQTRRKSDLPHRPGAVSRPNSRPGAAKGTEQAKIPPGKTWLWFMLDLARELLPGEAPHAGS